MAGIFAPFLLDPAFHLFRLFKEKEYRNYHLLASKLNKVPRHTPCQVKIHGWSLSSPDPASFLSTYHEVFLRKIHRFPWSGSSPKILDLGANIGLTTLYLKTLYPQSKITAFEADPHLFSYLKKNIAQSGFSQIRLLNKAAWNESKILKFHSEGADGGRVISSGKERTIEVEATDMGRFLETHEFDFLKMNIEGGEKVVLPSCAPYLNKIKYLFVEFHSRPSEKQELDKLLHLLEEGGHRVHVQNVINTPSPLLPSSKKSDFDLQLYIWSWRDDS